MKNNCIFFVYILFATNTFSQTVFTTTKSDTKTKPKISYIQYDFTVALTGNPNAGATNEYAKNKESWFIPDGLGSKIGYGLQYNKWASLGIHTGINWEWSNKLVAVPIYANFRLSQKIGDDARIVLQTGLGKAVALGRGSLSGDYKKISLGLQMDSTMFFIEISQYDFQLHNQKNIGNISLGLSMTSF